MSASTPDRGEVDAARARPPAPRRCARGCRARRRSRRPRRSAAGCRPRCWPTSPRSARPSRGRARPRRAALRRRAGPAASTGSSSTSAPSASASQCSGSSTAWCSTAVLRMRVRRGSCGAPGPEDALDREVVGLGAAGGEHDLAGAAVERLRDGLAGLLDDPAGVPAGGVQRAGVARPRAGAPSSPRRPPAPSGWWRRGRGRRSGRDEVVIAPTSVRRRAGSHPPGAVRRRSLRYAIVTW